MGLALLTVAAPACDTFSFPAPATIPHEFNIAPATFNNPPTDDPTFIESTLVDTIPTKTGHHASTITALPDGELLAAWFSYEGPEELDGAAIYLARKPADATEWSAPTLLIDSPAANPVLYSEGDRVWLFNAAPPFGWSTSHVNCRRSDDRGQTWSDPTELPGPLGTNCRNPPIRTASGELILPAYDDLLQRSLFFASADDGATWALRSGVYTPLPSANIQPAIAPLASGDLLAVLRNVGQGFLWTMRSDNDATSWTLPIDAGLPNPAAAVALRRLDSGNLLLIYNDDPAQRIDLAARLSPDDGRTWSTPRIIDDGVNQTEVSYPAITQTPDGRIHTTYTQSRTAIRHITINEAWILETP